jgi:FkbM family methyltransferase
MRPLKFDFPGGHSIQLYPDGAIAELLYTARFEKREISGALSAIKPGMKVIDVGANIGLYSILANQIVGGLGKVWAFEPSSQTARKLQKNLLLNNCRSVEFVQAALGDGKESSLTLQRDPDGQDGDRYLRPREAAVIRDGGDEEMVSVTSLDQFCESRGVLSVDFIKIDVEGGEFAVLRGSEAILRAGSRTIVMFECTQQGCARYGHTQRDVFEYLRNLGYVVAYRSRRGAWRTDEAGLREAGNVWAFADPKYIAA